MCGEPISSSPSATSTRFTGSFLPAPRIACSAASNAACGPFWLTAPRPIITLPTPGLSTMRASSGGDDHSGGIELLDVVHEVEADGLRRAGVERGEHARLAVGRERSSTCWKPASRASCAMCSAPAGEFEVLGGDRGQRDPVLQALDGFVVASSHSLRTSASGSPAAAAVLAGCGTAALRTVKAATASVTAFQSIPSGRFRMLSTLPKASICGAGQRIKKSFAIGPPPQSDGGSSCLPPHPSPAAVAWRSVRPGSGPTRPSPAAAAWPDRPPAAPSGPATGRDVGLAGSPPAARVLRVETVLVDGR